jgi:hypothetical protein
MSKVQQELDRHIRLLEERADKLRTIRSMLADDPELAADLLRILLQHDPTAALPSDPQVAELYSTARSKIAPHLDRITAFLQLGGNDWRSVRQITESTGLTRAAVNFVFYNSTHRDRFESQSRGPKEKVWRLVPTPKRSALVQAELEDLETVWDINGLPIPSNTAEGAPTPYGGPVHRGDEST